MRVLITALLLCISWFSQAQFLDRFTIQGGTGLSAYQGDIGSTIPELQSIRYNAKIGFNFRVYKFFHLHYHFSGTVLHNSDLYSTEKEKLNRGIFFKTDIYQGGFHFSFNQFLNQYSKVIHYFYFGTDVAMMYVNMEKRGGRTPLVEEGSINHFQWINPVGFGLGYKVSQRVGLVYEGTFFITHTDYVDGTAFNGNPGNRDTYFNSNLMLSVKLGKIKKTRRPSFNSRRYKFHLFEIPSVYEWD